MLVFYITLIGNKLKPGEQIKLSSASTHPGVPTWDGMDTEGLYMMVMVDIDAPAKGRDKNTNYLHWLIVNMAGDDMARANLVHKYTPPTPRMLNYNIFQHVNHNANIYTIVCCTLYTAKGSGRHRYVTLAYKQGGKIDHKELQKHLKDGPSSFSLPLLLSVAAHAGSRYVLLGNVIYTHSTVNVTLY